MRSAELDVNIFAIQHTQLRIGIGTAFYVLNVVSVTGVVLLSSVSILGY